MAYKFKLLVARTGFPKGTVIEVLNTRDLGTVTTSRGLVDLELVGGVCLKLIDPSRHLQEIGKKRPKLVRE